MEKKEKQLSPAIQLIDLVWEKSFQCMPHSWERFNAAMQDALRLAIKSGMVFELNDFKYISDNYRFGYWAGNDGHMQGERYYTEAVIKNNTKAVQSFEAWKKRKPFIFRDVGSDFGYGDMDERKSCRLFVGSKFKWKSEKVKVTSFSEDGKYVVACSHKDKQKDDYSPVEVKHIYKISNADLRKELKWLKKCDAFKTGIKLGSTFHHWIIDLYMTTVPENERTHYKFFSMFVR